MNKNTATSVYDYVINSKYALNESEKWEDICKRVAESLSQPEVSGKEWWSDKFFNVLKHKLFLPGGRILANAGRIKQNNFNCFICDVQDSIKGPDGWADTLHSITEIMSMGGGVGLSFDKVRPRGGAIKGVGGASNGSVAFMRTIDGLKYSISGGKNRGIALLFGQTLNHPDIIEFIRSKEQDGIISAANISIMIDDTEEFISNIDNPEYEIELKHGGKIYKKVNLTKVVDLAIDNMLKNGEPGFLNRDLMNSESTIQYYNPIVCVNPCLTGDTKVFVADGRGDVSLKQLAKEGKDVPVFAIGNRGQITIKKMRNPRLTGRKKPIYKMTLDDGSSIRCTDNHKFRLPDGNYRELKNLQIGDSLYTLTKKSQTLKDVFSKCNSKSQPYHFLYNGESNTGQLEHRIIARYAYGGKIPRGYVVHHKDYNSLNNRLDNLQVMTKESHDKLHAQNMLGNNNPMIRWFLNASEQERARYHKNMSKATSGLKNPRAFGTISNNDIREAAIKLTANYGRVITTTEWESWAYNNGYPRFFSNFRKKELGSVVELLNWAAKKNSLFPEKLDEIGTKGKRFFLDLVDQNYLPFIQNGKVCIKKICEECSKPFTIVANRREQGLCSMTCTAVRANRVGKDKIRFKLKQKHNERRNRLRLKQIQIYSNLKFQLQRDPLKREWALECKANSVSIELGRKSSPFLSWKELKDSHKFFNHKIVSIEFDGYEDVYNGTVDEHHNFFIALGNDLHNNIYINNLQCGELPHTNSGCCCLGSIDIAKFVTPNGRVNWNLLKDVTRTAVRMLDNSYDTTTWPNDKIRTVNQRLRKLGLGIMGAHHFLIRKGIKYSDMHKAGEALAEVMKVITTTAYWESVELSKEKGQFEALDREKFVESGFVKKLPKKLRENILEYGIRNCNLTSVAPTGSISIAANTSPSLEPCIAKAMIRRYNYRFKGKKVLFDECNVIDPLWLEVMGTEKEKLFEEAAEINFETHLHIQAAVQMWVDSAVSKTVNFRKGEVTRNEVKNLMKKYFPRLKGFTMLPEGSREAAPQRPVDEKVWRKWLDTKNYTTYGSEATCVGGKCDL